ncbi:MAG: DUF3795 domain-containing protein [Candidatus Neomarinimicrobiota bacterium]|jgi:hypothetical protein|nr:DUF3795 domain-containing protein [Candidatus Neomarinimicrobiota bacterium]MDD3965912.1 DUF3795 domain-containing protein [Candidatus Neomarinimicrobiota bacterium]MDX9780888.1 DUF3795 domain-containing protein [bacterium]
MNLASCGLICDECPFFQKECPGCFNTRGQPFWAKDVSEKGICPLFDCAVNQKAYRNCGDCSQLPCAMFLELKDPNISDAEHEKSLKLRIGNLRKSQS